MMKIKELLLKSALNLLIKLFKISTQKKKIKKKRRKKTRKKKPKKFERTRKNVLI